MNQSKARIGVYVCHCGTNIAGNVDVAAVAEHAGRLEGVVLVRDYAYMCSQPGQELIKTDIHQAGLNRVVVASCTPLMHEVTFRNAVSSEGLNPYFLNIANIREQCSWVHKDREKATEKAKQILRIKVFLRR